jgi:PAS domain S-box-containing protein
MATPRKMGRPPRADRRAKHPFYASLHATALAVMSHVELGSLLEILVERTGILMGSPNAFLYLETSGGSMQCRAAIGLRPLVTSVSREDDGIGTVWRTGRPLVVNDYEVWDGRGQPPARGLVASVLAVPVHLGGRVGGVVGVAREGGTRRPFRDDDADLLVAFAGLASIALDNSALIARERRARERAERLHAASRALAASIDSETLFGTILTELGRVVTATSTSIQVLSDGRLEIVAGRGHAAAFVGHRFDAAAGDGRSRRVIEGQAPVLLPAAPYADGAFADKPPAGVRSWMGVPLLFRGRVTGLLTLDNDVPDFYTSDEASLALAFAAQAAIAIENARLYGQARQELRERERAQAELAESERRHRDLFDQGLGLICTHDLTGRLLSLNPAAANSLGFSAAQMVGRNLLEFLSDPGRRLFSKYLATVTQDQVATGLMAILDVKGKPRLWRYRNVLRQDPGASPYVIGFAQDVTDETRAQRALGESEERLRQLAESVDAVFFMRQLDPPALLYMSPAYRRIFGQEAADPRPDAAAIFADVHPEDYARVSAAFAADKGGRFDEVYRIIRPDGTLRWIHTRTFPVDSPAPHAGRRMVGISADITSAKNAEALREDLTRTLVHDLRSPLMAIGASLQLLEDESVDRAERAAAIHTAQRSAAKLRGLVDSVLDIERLEHGGLPLERRWTSIEVLVDEILALAESAASARRIVLRKEIEAALPVWADPALLQRTIENVVGNALKFTPEGGQVQVRARARDGGVRFEVEDSGPGIPGSVAPRLFQKFSSGRGPGTGSGLGLAFCRLVVEAHGGRIFVERTSAEGTVIAFTLPGRPDAPPG